jgi:hypothetical protein
VIVSSRAILWTCGALLGIVATAAVAWAASQLTGQHVGLSSEPLSVVTGLAPATSVPARPVASHRPRPGRPAPERVVTVTVAAPSTSLGAGAAPSLPRTAPAHVAAPAGASVAPVPGTATTALTATAVRKVRDDSAAGGYRSGSGSSDNRPDD